MAGTIRDRVSDYIDDMVALQRPIVVYGGDLVFFSGTTLSLNGMSRANILDKMRTQISAEDIRGSEADADQSATDLDPTAAEVSIAVVCKLKDSRNLADERLFSSTVTWNDGAARTVTIIIDPTDRVVEIFVLMAFDNNGKPVIKASTAAGVTWTVTAGSVRGGATDGASAQIMNIIESDLQDL
jgi:hypothetical protein